MTDEPRGRPASRRERYRLETTTEAKRLALAQLATGGVGALSLNAIAREMGMTGPALYRYFDSRDDLLSELIIDTYTDFGNALWHTVEQSSGQPPPAQLRALCQAYRDWALANPQSYLLMFGTVVPGYRPPDLRTSAAAKRSLDALLTVVAGLDPDPAPACEQADKACAAWAANADAPPMPAHMVRFAITVWTRLHGVTSLEIAGHLDPALPSGHHFYAAEVDDILRVWPH